ncbi:MAG TPA: methionyl-tRNA formyltransferase [Thermoanaerobaculia bacterium]|nr:methionyl-tRNA formyltransferase [Thermoanaerobaculia bacterium]
MRRALRVVFFGTPEFALPTLDAVAAAHEVALVVAQPDRRAGRGMRLQKPPVAVRAEELGLPLVQPVKIRDEVFLQRIAAIAPDAGVVIAYGRILPGSLLEIPRHGFLNVHASLLPKYRGAAPIQRAIEAGETATGVTIMRVDEELDHGPMIETVALEIGPDERLPSVARRLARAGAEAMSRTLTAIESGRAVETPQDHQSATHAPKIEKEEGRITFTEPARVIYDRFRAFDPWPGVFFDSGGETILVSEMSPAAGGGFPARQVAEVGRSVVVGTGQGMVRLHELQRPGKPRAAAGDVARGLGWRAGARLP